MPRRVRVFVSSPSDVDEERRRVMEVIAALNRRYAGLVAIEGVFWEETVYPAHATFQAQIELPAACDLVICVLWSRLGSPLPQDWPARADGSRYDTGTVYEFETALAARRARELPDIFMFRKLLPEDRRALDELMERHPAERLRILDYLIRRSRDDSRAAVEMLEGFWARWFHAPEKGFIAAFNTFDTADRFADLTHQAIEQWLIAKDLVSRQPSWDIAALGSPYPGLEPFAMHHAAVFFGRARDTERAVALLRGTAETGLPWLLVTGPSGSGKSSLLRAGLVPALTEETPLETWRVAVVRAGQENPLAKLIEAIAAPEVLGAALAAGDYATAADLQRLACALPQDFARAVLRGLDRHGEAIRHERRRNTRPRSRLLLIIDQMEELGLAAAPAQAEFGAALMALLTAGDNLVWVAGTLRSDLQEPLLKVSELQTLITLEQGGRELKLAPPGPVDMREVIEGPARRAGLSFETREPDGRSLVDQLVEAVGGASDALPLLQMTLALLFERRERERGLLRWADYEAIGRLEGAIASHAEAVLERMPQTARDALGPLLRQLTRQWLSPEGEIELRPTELDEGRLSGDRADLAARLIEGRLLVADRGRLRVAHEAIFRNWKRAQDLLAADAELARLRMRIEPLLADWLAAGRDRSDGAHLLPPGAQLAAAEAAARHYSRDELGEDLADFIAASVAAERRQRTRRQRVLTITAATFASLALVALAGGLYAWHEQRIATSALAEAQRNYKLALDQAAGSIRQIVDNYDAGRISTPLMTVLIKRAQKTVRGLPSERPDVTVARIELLDVLSLADQTVGHLIAARKFANEAQSLVDRLKPTDLKAPQRRALWSKSRYRMGDILFWQGDLDGALDQLDAARASMGRLVAAAPDNRDFVKALIADIARSADTLRAEGRLPAAIKRYREWLAEARIWRHKAKDAEWAYSEADVHQRLGDSYLAMGEPQNAIAQYRLHGAIAKKLAARYPADRRYIRSIAWTHERVGDALLSENDLGGATKEYQAYLETARTLSEDDPTNFLWRQDFEVAYQRVGAVLLRRHDYAEALKEFGIYRSMTAATHNKDPANPMGIYDLADAWLKIGDAHREAGELDAAVQAYRQSLELANSLISKGSFNNAWQLITAILHQRLGVTFQSKGDRSAALAAFTACVNTRIIGVPYSPRIAWPKDVHAFCRQETHASPEGKPN